MNTKVFQNAKWIIVCKIIQTLLGFIISMFSARYLGPANYGTISYAASIVSFVTPLMQLGINNILVHTLIENKDEEGKILGSAILLHIVSALLCIVGILAFAFLANPNDPTTVIVCFLYSFLLLFQAMDALIYWFQAKLLSKYTSLVMLGAYLLVSLYKIGVLIAQKSVYWFAVTSTLDQMIIMIWLFFLYKKMGGEKLVFSPKMAKLLFDKGKHYILPSMMMMIYVQIDKIMIKGMLDETAVGYYSAAFNCITLSSFVFSAIIDSVRPVIFENKLTDEKAYHTNLARLYSVIIYLAVLQSLGLVIFGKYVILLLYGRQYMPAVNALQIAGWYAVFSHIGAVRNVWVLAEEKQKYLWIINFSGAVANVVLNVVLIPIMGINGAAVATLVTQFFANVVVSTAVKPLRENTKHMLSGMQPQRAVHLVVDLYKNFRRKS